MGTLAVYGLGRRLLDADAGLLAAFLFATAPFVVFMLLNFQLDLPLAAMVALALYALVRTEDLAVRRWVLGLGLVLGLGMLTKPPFAAYLSGPLLWIAWRALRAPDRRRAAAPPARRAGGGGGGRAAVVRAAPRRAAGPDHQPLVQAGGGIGARAGAHAAPRCCSIREWIIPQWGLLATALLLWGIVGARAPAAGPRAPVGRAGAVRDLRPDPEQEPALHAAPPARRRAGGGGRGGRAARRATRRGVAWACAIVGVAQVGSAAFALPPPTLLAPVVSSVAFS